MQKPSNGLAKPLVAPRDHFLDNAGLSDSDSDQEAVEEGMLIEAPVTPDKVNLPFDNANCSSDKLGDMLAERNSGQVEGHSRQAERDSGQAERHIRQAERNSGELEEATDVAEARDGGKESDDITLARATPSATQVLGELSLH